MDHIIEFENNYLIELICRVNIENHITMDDNHPNIIKMPDEAPVPEFGLGPVCFDSMKKFSDKIAQYIEETGESQTFGDLFEQSVKVAINLQKFGVSDDEIVCLCVGNRKYSIVPYIASLLIGKIVSALDPEMIPEEKATVLKKMNPKIIFVDDTDLDNMEQSLKLAEMNVKLVVIGEKSNSYQNLDEYLVVPESDFNNFQPVKVDNDRIATIFFSSGTTGVPKGICLSHLSILTRSTDLPAPTCLIFCKLNWISYALISIRCIRTGSPRVVMEVFDVDRFWKATAKYRIGGIFSPTFRVSSIVDKGLPKDLDVSCFKLLFCAGTALPKHVFMKALKTLPGVVLMQGYGLTEVGGPALVYDIMNPLHQKWYITKPDSCGTTIKGLWYKVVDPDTEEILGPNQPGELRLKSRYSMTGYYNMDSSDAYDEHGWFKTGDIVTYDEEHCFFVVDRIKDLLRFRGLEISSIALENVLLTHPAVEKATVIGLPHEEGNVVPMGIVVLRKGCSATPEEIRQFVDERVKEREKLRAGVKIIDEIPRTGTGKVQKRLLRKKALDGTL